MVFLVQCQDISIMVGRCGSRGSQEADWVLVLLTVFTQPVTLAYGMTASIQGGSFSPLKPFWRQS